VELGKVYIFITKNYYLIQSKVLLTFVCRLGTFQLSVASFHVWVPDVYEGAPTKTVVLLAIVPIIGIFFSFFPSDCP